MKRLTQALFRLLVAIVWVAIPRKIKGSAMTEHASHSKKSVWLNPFGLAMVAYYLVMAVIGICIPDDILKANTWAREFSDFMASIVPQIDRITALGIKPDVSRFYFSLMWAGSPIVFLFGLFHVWNGRKLGFPMWTMPFLKACGRMAGVIFMVAWTQFLWGVYPNMGLTKALFLSDLGRSFYSQFVFYLGPLYFLSGITAWLLGWLTGYIPRNIESALAGQGAAQTVGTAQVRSNGSVFVLARSIASATANDSTWKLAV